MSTSSEAAGGNRLAASAPALLVAASVVALAAAFIAQYGFGLRPCVLCIWQRWPYAAAILLGLAAMFVPRGGPRSLLLGAAGAALLVGGGIAAFHVGVEQHWWTGTAECTGAAGADTIEALRRQIIGAPVVRCDEIAFSLLGLSMAAWNLIYALAAAALAFWAAARLARRSV